jgi:hydroxymethylbilane synthase
MKNQKQHIIIGSRGSELALWQAYYIKRELEKKHKKLTVEVKIIKTKGDKILDVPLSKIGDKGLFTKELENALLRNEVDIAVHSLKDLQTVIPEGLTLAAVTKRHPVEDVLIARKKGTTIFDLPYNAVVATGALRRKSQLLHLRPDIRTVELRGNVPSRIKKFLESDWDAIILARAGVERLGLKKHISSFISADLMLPAVGQGVLGIEISSKRSDVAEIVQVLHDKKTAAAVLAERQFLKELEGGCQVPIGALGEVKSNGFYFTALVGSLDGSLIFKKKVRTSLAKSQNIGRQVAKDMLKAGAGEVLESIYSKRI